MRNSGAIDLARNRTLAWDDVDLDPERLKGLFELYFEQNADKSWQRKKKCEEYSLAFAMSQMFSPKQKELFKKRLEGLPPTKDGTGVLFPFGKENVVALANAELHGKNYDKKKPPILWAASCSPKWIFSIGLSISELQLQANRTNDGALLYTRP